MCYLFSPSLLMKAVWVTFDEAGLQPVLFSCCNSSLGMLHVNLSCLSCSLSFSIHILHIKSLIHPYELEIESNWLVRFSSALARASVVVHWPGCLLIYFVSKFQIFSSRFDLNAMVGFFRVWRRDSISRPSEKMHRSRAFSPKTTVSWCH